jgi:hypothetical protein
LESSAFLFPLLLALEDLVGVFVAGAGFLLSEAEGLKGGGVRGGGGIWRRAGEDELAGSTAKAKGGMDGALRLGLIDVGFDWDRFGCFACIPTAAAAAMERPCWSERGLDDGPSTSLPVINIQYLIHTIKKKNGRFDVKGGCDGETKIASPRIGISSATCPARRPALLFVTLLDPE